FFSSRRRHTRFSRDWSSDVCSSDLQLNPAFTRRITLDGPQQLLIPTAKAEMLAANLALMKPQELVNWQEYKVRPGDTLGAIANRHRLSVNVIRDINRLDGDHLRIGQLLSLPQSADRGS